jgi:hypothetical protein
VDSIVGVLLRTIVLIGCIMMAYAALGAIAGWSPTWRITEDGLMKNRRLWTWRRIRSIEPWYDGTELYISIAIGSRFFHRTKHIKTRPRLTPVQYKALAMRLIEEISPTYSHLKINPVVARRAPRDE